MEVILPISFRTYGSTVLPVVATRPSEEMFQALKKHIMRERQKKKEEQEADAEVERQRLERELKQKQDDMTLGENLEQIAQLEKTLAMLKEEKHQLFLQLKKVLNEDDNRRRLVQQQESEVNESYGGGYNNVSQNEMGMFNSVSTICLKNYARIVPSEHSLIPAGTLKRARSPSPPHLQIAYSTYGHNKSPAPRVTYSSSSHVSQANHSYNNSQFSVSGSRNEDTSTPPQRKQPLYLPQAIPARQFNPGYMHGSVEHGKPMMSEEMFYPIPPYLSTSHVPLHGGGIPIQQPAQGVRTGGITSGFPIRPASSAPPPPSHPRPGPASSSPHNVYVSQSSSISGGRVATNQMPPHNQTSSTSNRYLQREV